jgi:hypothetical protein
MFTTDEISDFFYGKSGELLELAYDGNDEKVVIRRKSENDLIATIPSNCGGSIDSFSIDAALSAPTCGVSFKLSDSQYVVHITKRFQIRSVIKIALNHLNWLDEERLQKRIFTPCSNGPPTE